MAELPLPTVLSLPAVSVNPSINCLQFSQDGQAVLLTKSAVYLLTPEVGVNVEMSSVIKQNLDPAKPPARSNRPLGWLRTLVEFDRSLAHQWPTDCADWGAVSLGSLDPSLLAVTLSPSNITVDAGCVVGLLNSNLELTIWSASKNLVTGEWIRLQDITFDLKTASAAAKSSLSAVEQALQLQSTCIEWSSQVDWNLSPALMIDASLLAVGNRAGCVTFLRYDNAERRMTILDAVSVSDRWLSHLAWSGWSLSQEGTCEAMLSCATSDGSVVNLTVRQTLCSQPSHTPISSDHEVGLSIQLHDVQACKPDGRAVTGMRWANVHGRSSILISHKAGVVHLWSLPSAQPAWSGSRTLQLRTHKRSANSSALHPASGICYVPARDLCVVALSDGSFHAIHKLSVHPSLDAPPSDAVSSDALSAVSRCVFARAESEKVSFQDVDRINGMATYDGCSTFMWTYEATRPADFSYKHDAKHVSTFVVAQLWEESVDDRVVLDLAERVGNTRCASGEAPISALRSILLHLRDPARISRLHLRILEILNHVPSNGAEPQFIIPIISGERTAELSCHLRKSLTTHLFGWDGVHSQRIRYAVSAFCQSHADAPDVEQKFAETSKLFLAGVRVHVHLTLMRHLSALSGLLHPHDIYFARRTLHQAAGIPGARPALAMEAEELLARLPCAPHPASNWDAPSADPGYGSLKEHCPACDAEIPLQSAEVESAVCANGHVWARCCITSFLLATPVVRTCVGCSRKAFISGPAPTRGPAAMGAVAPMPGDEGDDGGRGDGDQEEAWGGGVLPNSPSSHGWFVGNLVEATRRCPFCGNNFVVLV